jgi:hypothetical protein
MDLWIHEGKDQWVNASTDHSINRSWIERSIDHWKMDLQIFGPLDQSIIGLWFCVSLDQLIWINGSMDQWIYGSMDQWINGSTDQRNIKSCCCTILVLVHPYFLVVIAASWGSLFVIRSISCVLCISYLLLLESTQTWAIDGSRLSTR